MADGKALTVDQVEELSDIEVERLYARYSAHLGVDLSKKIPNAALGLYTGLVGMFVPVPDQPGLIGDLESDPFLSSALLGAASELYHRYGTWLAPLTATLITLKHARFENCCTIRSYDDCGDA